MISLKFKSNTNSNKLMLFSLITHTLTLVCWLNFFLKNTWFNPNSLFCLRRQREDNESRNIQFASRRAHYSWQRQQILGGDHILVGGPANLNEEDVVHSNSTSTNPSLIPHNQEAGQSHRLTHICNLARNMPVEHRAMQEVNGEIIVLYL